jgi:hypothetical protein
VHTHSPNTPKKFKQALSAQKAAGNCFLGQERSADGGIRATRDHNNARSVLRNTKKCIGPFRKKRRGMLIVSVVLFLDHACTHTAAFTGALLEHFNWELFDHPPYSLSVSSKDYHLFTYLKNWLRSQRFKNNEELMEGVKTLLSSQAANFSDTGIEKIRLLYKCLNSGGDYVKKNHLKYPRSFYI